MLDAEEVLAALDASGDGDGDLALVCDGVCQSLYPACGNCEGKSERTVTRPLEVARPEPGRPVLVDLEPHGALGVEVLGRLARGDLGEVGVQRAGVEDLAAADGDGDGAAGTDAEGLRRALAGVHLVACHGSGVEVGDGAVGILVLGQADRGPVGGACTVVDGAGERVVRVDTGRCEERE